MREACFKKTTRRLQLSFLCLFIISFASGLFAKGRFNEMVLTLEQEGPVYYRADDQAGAILLHFKSAKMGELSPLQLYDERLIKRLLIKERSDQSIEVALFLRDKQLRAVVQEFQEPYRISISIFDKDYSVEKDLYTSLPLSGLGEDQGPRNSSKESQSDPLSGWTMLGSRTSEAQGFQAVNSSSPVSTASASIETGGSPQNLEEQLEKAAVGRGSAWKEIFPPYMYPLPLTAFEGDGKKAQGSAALSKLAPAEQAFQLFNLGDEHKAFVIYKQVLLTDPSLFDRDVLHLWALSEIHLGLENFVLADSYEQTLMEKFPESPLSRFAGLRRLDIESLPLLKEAKEKPEILSSVLKKLEAFESSVVPEVRAQAAVRKAFWMDPASLMESKPPEASAQVAEVLEKNLEKLESRKTAFLAESILFHYDIQVQKEKKEKALLIPQNLLHLAAEYFKKYEPASSDPFYKSLEREFKESCAKSIIQTSHIGLYDQATQLYESLPGAVHKDLLQEETDVALALAEAYRGSGHPEKALEPYKISAGSKTQKTTAFMSNFWGQSLSLSIMKTDKKSGGKISKTNLMEKAKEFDEALTKSWNDLDETEKDKIQKAYQKELETLALEGSPLKGHSTILLQMLEKKLAVKSNPGQSHAEKATETKTDEAKLSEMQKEKTDDPSATVQLIHALAVRFKQLGEKEERRRALLLLKTTNPKDFSSHAQSKILWVNDLVALAEEYREEDAFADAGRTYVFAAEHSLDWDKKAESFYKAGLLLIKSGRREEAVAALTQASQDANNVFYARLAKERLDQLTR